MLGFGIHAFNPLKKEATNWCGWKFYLAGENVTGVGENASDDGTTKRF